MNLKPVIAIFDVGKTNKKLFLFDEQYKLVYEKSARFTEIFDEDGEICENLESLRRSVYDSLRELINLNKFDVRAVNFATYGASFVYINAKGKPLTPLYNYLKVYPEKLHQSFYEKYDGEEAFSLTTASPILGSLNSGLQLYRLKYEQPEIYAQTKFALHLPQYISYLFTHQAYADKTSIGCHTSLWDFEKQAYHYWVKEENLTAKLAPIISSEEVITTRFNGVTFKVGTGLHDSSAALIPYLISFNEPFVLLSTGTWCISFNPFNHLPLTIEELKADCLNYLQYKGMPVKASRLFAGYEHEQQVKRISLHFSHDSLKFRTMEFDPQVVRQLEIEVDQSVNFGERDLSVFSNGQMAYHQLMIDIIKQQKVATKLVLDGTNVNRIFVDGGFSKNSIFMHLLAAAFPGLEVFAASMAQATAVGTALAIHQSWNSKPFPNDLIELKYYSVKGSPNV
ncbi:sugar (pentulose or hexulose) kinase [Pedobacter sp. CG_S7]|uniref:FGGY-family carbohydrate kinase n=1 Tax=Pedobacter sp. CG_S7 TaxID=3143930 RepID=UPI003397E8B1